MKEKGITVITPNNRINYDFGTMEIGETRRIKVNKSLRDRTLFNLRSACSREKASSKGISCTCWADDSGVYYKREA